MKRLSISVQDRSAVGTTGSNIVRKSGFIPAVVYGKSGSRAIQVAEKEFRTLYKSIIGSSALIELTQEGAEPTLTLLQDVQRNATTDAFRHIDFRAVARNEKLTTKVKIHVVGEADGVKNSGGVLEVAVHEIEVRCLPDDLPEYVEVDVSHMKNGDNLHRSELPKLKGVEYPGDPKAALIHCAEPTVVEEEAPAAEAAAAPAAGAAPAAPAAAPAKK